MRDEGFGIWPIFGLLPSIFWSLLHPRRQLADREEAAVARFDLIGDRALENDLGPGVVGDFHQAGSERVFAVQGNGRAVERGRGVVGPLAIDHAGDPAHELLLRLMSEPAFRGRRQRLAGELRRLGHGHEGADQEPEPEKHDCHQIRQRPTLGRSSLRGPGPRR